METSKSIGTRDSKTTFSSSKNVLSGVKLMDWMLQNGIVKNREEGMSLARDLFGTKILRHSKCVMSTSIVLLIVENYMCTYRVKQKKN